MAMSFKPVAAVAAVAAMLSLSGCDTIHPNGSTDPGFGEVARYNAALQVINPDPVVVAGAAVPGDNGAVGAASAKRYRTNSVKQPEQVQTTSSGSSGSSRNQQ